MTLRDPDLRRAYAFAAGSNALVLPFYALIFQSRGFGPREIGLFLGLYAIAGAAMAPGCGQLADRSLGAVRTLTGLLLACSVTSVSLAFSGHSIVLTAIGMTAAGAFCMPTTGLIDSIALSHLGPAGHRYPAFRAFASIGWAAVVIPFGFFFDHAGFKWAFPLYAVALVVYARTMWRFRTPKKHRIVGSPVRARAAVGEALRDTPGFASFLMGILIVSTATAASWSFVPLQISHGTSQAASLSGVGFGVSALIEVPFMLWVTRLGAKTDVRWLYVAGTTSYALEMALWALFPNPVVTAVVLISRGFAFALAYTSMVRLAGSMVPASLRGTGQLLTGMAGGGIAQTVGSLLGGWLFATGPAHLFAISAVVVLAGTAVVFVATGADRQREPSPVPQIELAPSS